MAVPEGDGGEWIELAAGPDSVVELADYYLSDAGGIPRRLPSRRLVPGERVVLVQDADVFRAWWEGLLAAGAPPPCPGMPPMPPLAEWSGSWPALNNSPADGRPYAERVHLCDAEGTVLDHATLGARGTVLTRGRSQERRAAAAPGDPADLWGTCMAAAGATPGCRNSLESPLHVPPCRPGGIARHLRGRPRRGELHPESSGAGRGLASLGMGPLGKVRAGSRWRRPRPGQPSCGMGRMRRRRLFRAARSLRRGAGPSRSGWWSAGPDTAARRGGAPGGAVRAAAGTGGRRTRRSPRFLHRATHGVGGRPRFRRRLVCGTASRGRPAGWSA